jgi:hypothetical protein
LLGSDERRSDLASKNACFVLDGDGDGDGVVVLVASGDL